MKRFGVILMFLIAGAAFWVVQPPSKYILVSSGHAALLDDQSDRLRVYFQIENSGGPDMLKAVQSPLAEKAELYNPESDTGIPIPANSAPTLAVDGAHIVLTPGEAPVSPGQLIPVTLEFLNAGTVTAKARVADDRAASLQEQAGLFGYGGICRVEEGEPAPDIALEVTPIGDDNWRVDVAATEFDFREDLVDYPHVPGTGHGHLFVGGMKLDRLYEPSFETGPLPPGEHVIRVTLSTNDHRAYVVDDKPVSATVTVRVD